MGMTVKVSIHVDYIQREIRLMFPEPVTDVGFSMDQVETFIKILQDKANEIRRKIISVPTMTKINGGE